MAANELLSIKSVYKVLKVHKVISYLVSSRAKPTRLDLPRLTSVKAGRLVVEPRRRDPFLDVIARSPNGAAISRCHSRESGNLCYHKLMNSNRKIITLCSSASFFKEVIDIGKKLKQLGFKVLLPQTAYRMAKNGDYNIAHYKPWLARSGVIPSKAEACPTASFRRGYKA